MLPSGPKGAWRASSRSVPPLPAEPILDRPRLERLLEDAGTRRLVTVVAAAGYGKSTLLAAWAQQRAAAWYTVTPRDGDVAVMAAGLLEALAVRVPGLQAGVGDVWPSSTGPDARTDERVRADAYAALLSDALERLLSRDLFLVLDDLGEITASDPAARLVEALAKMGPSRLHLILSSREDPPFRMLRLRGRGQVTTLGASELAFTDAETRQLLGDLLGRADGRRLAPLLQEATQGWPAAVRLAAEALLPVPGTDREATMERVLRPGGPIYEYLVEEALQRTEPWLASLLGATTELPRFSAELCAALGVTVTESSLERLARRGLFVQPSAEPGWYEVHPLLRQLAPGIVDGGRGGDARHLERAAAWFGEHGYLADALHCLASAGDVRGLAAVLEMGGRQLLDAGEVEQVAEALRLIPEDERTPMLHALVGETSQLRGEWDAALRSYERVREPDGSYPAAVAWRMGIIQHLRGELPAALETYGRGRLGDESADEALLRAWWASALWLQGATDAARQHANEALAIATRIRDDRALAAAHTVQAMLAAVASDRRANDAHYLRALGHATRAGDALQLIRIHANRGSHFAEEGYYREALAELDEAVTLADLAGFAAFRALALSNRGEVLWHLGRLDEAIVELESSRALYQRLESRLVAYPLVHLGEVYRERGDAALARAHFEEAIRVSEAGRDLQALVPALGGLAGVIVGDEPDRALALAEQAVGHGPVLGHIEALLALGSVQLARGCREEAQAAARSAEQLARTRRDRAGLAAAMELIARSADDPASERSRLEEARSIWNDLESPLASARVSLALAEVGEGAEAAHAAEAARRVFTEHGARLGAAAAGDVLDRLADIRPASLEINTLGGFEILRGGRPVSIAEWRSRKARDLLRMLVAARGRRVARDQLIEWLWPDGDADRAGPRLSVALSTVRAVLDPAKELPPDRYVAANRASVWLRVEDIELDVERFHKRAAEGLQLATTDTEAAEAALVAAEALYRGDFLGDDPYDDWAVAEREEARSLYTRVAHALAAISAARADADAAASYLRRVLEHDPYDEPAHLELVRLLSLGGHHGEARRAYRAYAARMDEIGVEAATMGEAQGPEH